MYKKKAAAFLIRKCQNHFSDRLLLLTLSEKVMIIVTQGYVRNKDSMRIFVGLEALCCPVCSGSLKVHGTCRRGLQCEDGKHLYRLRVMKCCRCGRTHRELPAGIVPYKRLDVNCIAQIATILPDKHLTICETSTWRRVTAWVNWFLWYAQKVLESIRISLPELMPPNFGGGLAEQLMYFVRLVANSGFWIQHRTAQTKG